MKRRKKCVPNSNRLCMYLFCQGKKGKIRFKVTDPLMLIIYFITTFEQKWNGENGQRSVVS